MSAAAASPIPPPPESKSWATKPEKKNRSYKKLPEDSGKQDYCSANVTSTPDRSLIRSWLEGKLDDDDHPVADEGGASSISPTAPAVSRTPISSAAPILMLQLDDGSILSNSINHVEIVADASGNRIAAVYDPFINGWYLLPMEVYHVVFGTNIDRQPPPPPPPPSPPVDENDDKNKFQTSAIKPKTILIGEIEVPVILPPTTTIARGYEDEQEINNANEAVKEEAGKGKKKKNNNKKKKNKGKKK